MLVGWVGRVVCTTFQILSVQFVQVADSLVPRRVCVGIKPCLSLAGSIEIRMVLQGKLFIKPDEGNVPILIENVDAAT